MNSIDTVVLSGIICMENATSLPTVPPIKDTTPEGIWRWGKRIIPWMSRFAKNVLLPLGEKLVIALIIFFIGKKIIQLLRKIMNHSLRKTSAEEGVVHFLDSIVRTAGYIILVMIIADYMGIGTSSIIALVGSAGLAIGLALQGSLSNFAGGVLILITKPFRIGDYIVALGNEGTVTGIDIFYTRLLTADNRMVVIPNGTLTNSNIINVTQEPIRRVDVRIGIEYSENVQKVKELLMKIAMADEMVLQEKEIQVFIDSFDASSVMMELRVWAATENYWTVKWNLREQIKEAFEENEIIIPFDQLEVNITSKEVE